MNNKALTMMELILVIVLLGFALVGLLISYVSSLGLSEYDKNLTIAMNIAREKMEELYNQRFEDFDNLGVDMCPDPPNGCSVSGDDALRIVSFDNNYIKTNYNNFNGSCTIYITELDQNLKEARIVVCWKQRVGRIIGEDNNLDGAFDGGDDNADGNNALNSPCEIISAFTQR